MENKKILSILKSHNVPCYEHDGRVYADTMISSKPVFAEVDDLTGYTLEQIREWLGY